ncbi:MAG: hypothetical protein JO272_10220 [Pseudonocardiales bacterium]|nr:hypothetical protein [Pseudonocardiales bacterium]
MTLRGQHDSHPRAHQRAFVLVPWLDVAPAAERRSVHRRDDLRLDSR